MSEIEMVKCPFCGQHKSLRRTGIRRIQKGKTFDRPYEFAFDHVDPLESGFISIRECQGRGGGFPEIRRITLREIVQNGNYPELRQGLTAQCAKVLKILLGEEQ